jgi:DNA ligase-1
MLGAKLKPEQDLEDLPYPLYASPKIDGIRACTVQGRYLSRTLKEIPNWYIQRSISFFNLPNGLDGELAVGDLCHPNLMQRCMSGVMSQEGNPVFTFNVFDLWTTPARPYWWRYEQLQAIVAKLGDSTHVRLVPQTLVHSSEELRNYENDQLRLGYEGVIVRTPTSRYKYGRSTFREGYLIKLKRYTDAEAIVVGFEELLTNTNPLERDERGYAKRSSHQANLVGSGTLGTLVCRDLATGQEVRLGSGFTARERDDIWAARERYAGLCVTYKHFAVTGVVAGRRQPIFKCFRDLRDVGGA